VKFDRKLFPERRYRLPLRWLMWLGMVVLLLAVFLLARMLR